MPTNDNGISKDSVPTGWTLVAIIVFISMALHHVVELSFIILAMDLQATQRALAAGDIAPYAVGFLLKALQVMNTTWVHVRDADRDWLVCHGFRVERCSVSTAVSI